MPKYSIEEIRFWKLSAVCVLVASGFIIIDTLISRQNGHHFSDGIFKYISLKENIGILIQIQGE